MAIGPLNTSRLSGSTGSQKELGRRSCWCATRGLPPAIPLADVQIGPGLEKHNEEFEKKIKTKNKTNNKHKNTITTSIGASTQDFGI